MGEGEGEGEEKKKRQRTLIIEPINKLAFTKYLFIYLLVFCKGVIRSS